MLLSPWPKLATICPTPAVPKFICCSGKIHLAQDHRSNKENCIQNQENGAIHLARPRICAVWHYEQLLEHQRRIGPCKHTSGPQAPLEKALVLKLTVKKRENCPVFWNVKASAPSGITWYSSQVERRTKSQPRAAPHANAHPQRADSELERKLAKVGGSRSPTTSWHYFTHLREG